MLPTRNFANLPHFYDHVHRAIKFSNIWDNDWLTTSILQQTLSTVYSIGLLDMHTILPAGSSSIIRDKHNYKHNLTGSSGISIPRWSQKEHFLVVSNYQSMLQKSKDLIHKIVEAWNHATILSDDGSRDCFKKALYTKMCQTDNIQCPT